MAGIEANGQLIKALRERHGLSLGSLAKELGFGSDELEEVEGKASTDISHRRAESLAELFGVSVFDLDATPDEVVTPVLPDFRTEKSKPAKVGVSTWKRIRKVQRYRDAIAEIYEDDPDIIKARKFKNYSLESKPAEVAAHIRHVIGLDWGYQAKPDRSETLYDVLRWNIEVAGVNVTQLSYPITDSRRFYVASDVPGANVICVNSKNAKKKARVFTLAHELAHALIRQEGISDYLILRNKVEKFCNAVAAETLLPSEQFSRWFRDNLGAANLTNTRLRNAAEVLGVSQYSLAVRLENLRLVEDGFVGQWLASMPKNLQDKFEEGNLDPEFDGGEEETAIYGPLTGANKVAEVGSGIASLALASVERQTRDPIDIYRNFRINPEHLDAVRTNLTNKIKASRSR